MATAAGPTLATSLTEHQQKALETRDVNVALSAGAGCGKTFVLTQRFLSHLEPDGRGDAAGQLGRLIAITFTERAAREMRERIRAGVRDRLMKAPAEQEAHWLEILRRIDSARISTIHSFCGTLLRSNAVEAQLDPGFSILEPTAARQLLDELVDDRLRELLSEQNDDMLELTAGFDLNGVRQRIAGLLKERFRLKFEDWLPLRPRELVDQWKQFHETHIKPAALDELRNAPAVRKLRDETLPQTPPHPKLAERAATIAELLCRIAEQDPTDADFDAIAEHAMVVGCTGKKIWAGQEELYEAYKEGFKALRELADKVRGKLIFDAVGALPAAEATLRFIRLAAPIQFKYERRKTELGVLDFDDLLIRAYRLLEDNAELSKRLAYSTELLLVDECQDTDELQVNLINRLVGLIPSENLDLSQGKLFHVGDFKQSIYRFRGADPSVFQKLQESTAKDGRIPLFLNFRSQPAVLDFVNVMFAPIFGEQYQPLAPNKEQVSPSPAVEFMWAYEPPPAVDESRAGDDADSPPPPAKHNAEKARRLEADWIARRIAGLVRNEEPRLPLEKNSPQLRSGELPLRPIDYGDCALLFRALSNVAIYEAALERYGIPYYVVGGKAFYAQQEIYDLLNFLRVLDSVCDDIALAGVLRSPFFSLADEDLYWLAQHKSGLAGGLFAPHITDELKAEPRRKAEFAARTLRDLREIKNRIPIAELINEIFARTAYDAIITAEFLGDRKLANLRKLIEQARAFDASGIFTLTAFIEQLSTSVVEQPDEAPAAAFAEGANVVRLMSIHQSKGLEFPVVFVPDLERKRQHNRATVAFHPELGPMVGPPYREEGASGLDLYRLVENLEDEAESKRLFYVATTRAADYLVLSAGVEDPAEPTGEWRTLLAGRFDLTTGKVIGALPAGMRSPDVHVIAERPKLDDDRTVKRERADWPKIFEQVRKAAKSPKAKLREGTEPIAADLAARRRFSFSRLSGKIISAEDAEEERGDAGDKLTAPVELATSSTALDGRTIGIAVHDALAKFDYRALGGSSQRPQIERLLRRALDGVVVPSSDETEQVLKLVETFLESPRARSIAAARQVHRELEFLLSWPLEKPATDGVYLQGFLDLLYEDAAGRWCVVDYKTHQAASANVSVAAEPYKLQLAVYALAAEKILGRAPDELVLFFLRTGEEFAVPWNDAARRRAIEAVNQGLAAALQGE